MNEDKIVGKAKAIGGKAEESLGHVTGNARLEAKGVVNEIKGKVQQAYGQARDAFKDSADATKENVANINEHARHAIAGTPYISVIATFMLGIAFGLLAVR